MREISASKIVAPNIKIDTAIAERQFASLFFKRAHLEQKDPFPAVSIDLRAFSFAERAHCVAISRIQPAPLDHFTFSQSLALHQHGIAEHRVLILLVRDMQLPFIAGFFIVVPVNSCFSAREMIELLIRREHGPG